MKCESLAWSQVQGILARGDIKVAEVLANIETVSLSDWRRAFKKSRLDIDFYAHQRWDVNKRLPWSIIDSGTELDKLKLELTRALS